MFLLIDKPKGITSHDVIDRVRKITGERRVGHAGTLDPNATGLLIVGVTRESTKKLGDLAKNTTKEYVAEIRLGIEKDTDDAMGKTIKKWKPKNKKEILRLASLAQDDKENRSIVLSLSNVKRTVEGFIGEQEQMPPLFSAIKIGGKKAYEMARKGDSISLSPRKIIIHSIDLVNYKYPILNISCLVSSGTYIRSLARDIGKKLGCGAYLKNLRRTKIGEYAIESAVELETLTPDNWNGYAIDIII